MLRLTGFGDSLIQQLTMSSLLLFLTVLTVAPALSAVFVLRALPLAAVLAGAVSEIRATCSVQFSSVAQSCLTLCHPMNRSTPGLPVHHQLSEFTETHVHRVSDAIQPSHPLSSPSPPAPNPSQHQSFPMSQHFA